MKTRLPALLLLATALPMMAAENDQEKKYTPIDRPGHASSHVINDAEQIQQLRRALKQAAVPSGNGINYHGGPVMSNNVTIYYIWYGNWNGNNGVTLLESFAKNLGGSPYYNINTTYTDGSGNAVRNTLLFGGSVVDSYSQGTNLSDAQIWQAVSAAITSGKFPSDPNAVYFLLTSHDVNATSGFCTQYCGWHTYNTLNGVPIKYAFVGDGGRCPSSCTAQPTNSPNGNVGADGMASVIAHELSESVSDPQLNAWWDSNGEENGDKCAWTWGVTFGVSNGSRANMTLAGTNYLIQQMWVNSGGGSCIMQYIVPAATGISPASGAQGASVPITLTGANFAAGANLAISGVGVTTSNLQVVSPTQITATLNIASGADLGAHNVSVTLGAAVSSPVTFTVNSGSGPSVSGIAPASGVVGATVPVTLTGSNFASGATVAVSGAGVTVSNVQVVSATQITAQLAIASSAATGARSVTVTVGSSTSAPVSFMVNAPAVSLTGISPASGAAGATVPVTLTGGNFASGATVAVSGTGVTVSNVQVVSATQMTAQLAIASSAATGARNITVTVGSSTSGPVTFTVNAASGVGLTGISPATGATGATVPVTLTGSGFASGATVSVSGAGVTVSNIQVVSATQITAQLAIASSVATGARNVTVTMGSSTSGPVTFAITPPVMTLTGITPSSSQPGATVKVTVAGTNFVSGATVAVSGTGVTASGVTVVSPTQMTANFAVASSAAVGARNVTVLTGSTTTAAVTFTVSGPPTLTSISPASGSAGATTSVTLTGTNFTSGATVAVSGTGITVSGVTVASPTQITANFAVASSAAAGSRNVTVSNGSSSTGAVAFTVIPAPTLSAISPDSAQAGATAKITLSGANFAPGATVGVSGSGVTVSGVTVVSSTQISATLTIDKAATAGLRNVTVASGNGSTGPVVFTIKAAATLTSISPATAASGTTTKVTFTGTNFAAGSTVAVSGTGVTVTGVSLVSATQITANFVVDPVAAPGARNVTVTSASFTTSPATFTVTSLPMALASISPASGAAGATVAVTLTGTHFAAGSTVAVSGTGVTVTGVTVASPTQMTAQFAIAGNAATGARNVTVSNGSVTTAAVTFTIGAGSPPALTKLDKTTGAAGSTMSITATGANFGTSNNLVFTGTGITVSNVQTVSATQITATVAIDAAAAMGARNVTVSGNNGSTAPLTFTVTGPTAGGGGTPKITSLTPASGVLGTALQMTVSGSGFTQNASVVVADAGIPVLQTTYVSPTQMLVVLGLGGSIGQHTLQVSVAGSTSAPATFTITSPGAPTITNVNPASSGPGKTITVTINGANFTPGMSVAISGSGATVGNITSASATWVTFPLTIAGNATPGARMLTITTPGGTSNQVAFTVTSN